MQRGFAAECLCPAASALEQVDGDSSEPALEQVVERFDVSADIVETLIDNQNGVQ
jgi:hypothetical protein